METYSYCIALHITGLFLFKPPFDDSKWGFAKLMLLCGGQINEIRLFGWQKTVYSKQHN